jgi:hypothetical protein
VVRFHLNLDGYRSQTASFSLEKDGTAVVRLVKKKVRRPHGDDEDPERIRKL